MIVAVAAIAALFVAAIVVLTHRGPGARDAGAQQVLRVGNQRGGTHALMLAAGVLKDAPYQIQWSEFAAASPLLEALSANAIDLGGVGGAPFAFAYSGGAKLQAVEATRAEGDGRTSAIVVPKTSPLKTVADLRGRKIATIRGSAGQDLALRLLETAGLRAEDVRFVYLNNADAKAALATGAVDAWSTWSSYVGIAVLGGEDRILADATGIRRTAGFEVATDRALADKRAAIADFIRRLAKAQRWSATHKEAYAAMLAKEIGVPLDVARFVAGAEMVPVPIDDALVREEGQTFERYRRAGLIDKVPDLAGAYNHSFNEAVNP